MNNRYFYFIATIFLVAIVYFKQEIVDNTLYLANQTKSSIQIYITYTEQVISNHFNQVEKIKTLTKQNQEYKNYLAQLNPILMNYKKLKQFKNINSPKVTFTQTISYANLPDITSIYIDYKDKNMSIPQGLIYNNQTAGIVIKSIKNFSLAYLNNNENTSYTVFVGKKKIPGILFGGETMRIKYIPKYHKLHIGDLVVTSGLDKIFYEGVNVGKVTKVIQKILYQEVIVKPFYNSLHPKFFYVVR